MLLLLLFFSVPPRRGPELRERVLDGGSADQDAVRRVKPRLPIIAAGVSQYTLVSAQAAAHPHSRYKDSRVQHIRDSRPCQ